MMPAGGSKVLAMPSAPSLPAAVEAAYALWLWLDARVVDFPTHALQSGAPQ